ncbi:hypothetical protein [Siccirubricoccus phaeus]|uniref:hypothetical protein n=1 Tax=Siccirubricoccus phaeus TaxID=2595053 RepID=UPI0011F2FAF6|nr:hypothetical protein [Siccirubricoccus phaeus]
MPPRPAARMARALEMAGRAALLGALLLLWPCPAPAQDRVAVRVGDHPTHGRLVFDWPAPPAFTAEQQGENLLLRFPAGAALDLAGARRPPRNMRGVTQEEGVVVVALKPGVRARVFRIGNRLVVDALNPQAAPAAEAPPGLAAPAQAATPQAASQAMLPPAALSGRAAAAPAARGTAVEQGLAEGVPPAAASPARAAAARGTQERPVAKTPLAQAAPAERPAPRDREGRPEPTPPRAAAARPASPPAAPGTAIAAAPGAALPAVPAPPVAPPPPVAAAPTPPVQQLAVAAPAQPGRAEPTPPPAPPPPEALPARLLGPAGQDRALLLAYPRGTGAALLRRGAQWLAVFDDATPLNLAALRNDPNFGATEAEPVPGGMLLRLALPDGTLPRARREALGWVIEAVRGADPRDAAQPGRGMALELEGNPPARIAILAEQPTRVLAIADPESGMPLLLGLVASPGQAMLAARRLPELDLPPTRLGAAVLARADRVTLRAGPDRFLLAAIGARLTLDDIAAQPPAAPAMTRSFDFPAMLPGQLLERVRSLQAGLAATPPLSRAPQRRAAAEALLALGLPQEAQSMIGLAMAESPAAAADPVLRVLGGIAAALAGRLAEAAPLREVALPESDELSFWRAYLATAQGEPAAAAPGFAATLPLLLDYPAPLRARLLPPVALALAEGGEAAALRSLLAAAPPELDLRLARGILAEAQGKPEEALAAYDAVAQGRDRLARARALRRAIELRLATGRIDAAAAAKAMEATLFAWRGDATEIAARLRLAELRRAAGDARGAMALLKESEPLFPEQTAQLRAGIADAFLAALEGEPPLSAVALFDAYPELLPGGERGEQAVLLLAERLASLDLVERAALLLRQAAERAAGPQRSSLGLRLAALKLADGDGAAALEALAATEVPNPSTALAQGRVLLAARAEARRGRLAEAKQLLLPIGAAGLETLADLLAEAQDWPGAATALGAHLRAVAPAGAAPLPEPEQRAVLRQAAILALAGDEAALAALRTDHAARLADPRLAAAFQALTGDPMRGLSDLPRLQQELQLFRSLPTRLEALRAGAPVAR